MIFARFLVLLRVWRPLSTAIESPLQAERVVTVELEHKWQDDWTFDISGKAGPVESMKLSCSSMEEPVRAD